MTAATAATTAGAMMIVIARPAASPALFALALLSCAGVERYRPRDRYDDRRGRDDYDRRDRGRDDYDRRDDRL